MKRNNRRGVLATAGALITAAALALGGAAAAQAAPPEIPESATVKIRKTEAPAVSGAATGKRLADESVLGYGINGVTFRATLVPVAGGDTAIDLSTNAGQLDAAGLTAAAAKTRIEAASPAMDSEDFPVTNTDGPNGAGWTSLELDRGLYYVEEVSVPAGVTPSAPFLVAVPLTNPTDRDAWLTEIFIYPKNDTFSTEKTVTEVIDADNDEISRTVGQQFAYTIVSDVPADRGLTAYSITDSLNANLTLDAGSLKVDIVDAAGTVLTPLELTTDYTVANPLTIALNGTGLGKLNAAAAGAQVRVTYTVTVNADAGSVDVANSATTSATNEYGTSTATDSVTVPFGDIDIVKKSSENEALLGGATFRVYTNPTDAAAGNNNYLTINSVSEWATDDVTGAVTIPGLLYSNFVDGVTVTDEDQYRAYYLVEINAPEGHQLLVDPVEVFVLGKSDTQIDTQIINVANTGGFVLPLTGGMGTAVLTFGGVAILAVVLLVARSRRNEEAAAE